MSFILFYANGRETVKAYDFRVYIPISASYAFFIFLKFLISAIYTIHNLVKVIGVYRIIFKGYFSVIVVKALF